VIDYSTRYLWYWSLYKPLYFCFIINMYSKERSDCDKIYFNIFCVFINYFTSDIYTAPYSTFTNLPHKVVFYLHNQMWKKGDLLPKHRISKHIKVLTSLKGCRYLPDGRLKPSFFLYSFKWGHFQNISFITFVVVIVSWWFKKKQKIPSNFSKSNLRYQWTVTS
jgi:hypothetical protein